MMSLKIATRRTNVTYKGNLLLAFSLAVTLVLYAFSKSNISQIFENPILSSSQLFSLLGVTLLVFTFLLSSRLNFLESWFGPLDVSYKKHHLFGGISFFLLIHHPLFLVMQNLPLLNFVSTYLLLGNTWVYNFGILAIYLLILLLIFTFIINLPYQLWLFTHQFLGLILVLAALHIFLIDSDVSRYLPLRLWVLGLISIALGAFVYRKFLYSYLAPKYEYVIDLITKVDDFTDIYLKPTSVPIKFYPGQFAFFTFFSPHLKSESHPFSLASNPNDSPLRICVKNLGDFTSRLHQLNIGDKVLLHGPFGRFGLNFYNSPKVVAIAGGVGVTPFLSLFRSVPAESTTNYNFFYAARNKSLALDHPFFSGLKLNNFNYHPWFSDSHSRLTAADIKKEIGNLNGINFFLCGPYSMMIDLRDQLIKLGVSQRFIFFEDFNLK